jgi:hypothetical protein
MTVTRVMAPGNPNPTVIGENLKVLLTITDRKLTA